MSEANLLDPYLAPEIRTVIEQRYYAQINEQARMENAIHDAEFLLDPENHIALYPDHGVVHVRDVAKQVLSVLDTVHGVLIPLRDERRFRFMKSYGVMLAYVHDIGMKDFSRFGRAMHPEYATQAVLGPEFDDIINAIWTGNSGGLTVYLSDLYAHGVLRREPRYVLREMLAMSNCHSKAKVPVSVLNDPASLLSTMQQSASSSLESLYVRQQRNLPAGHTPAGLAARTLEPAAFEWLMPAPGQPESANLLEDVVDTLRTLRCADALRQRGTVLKTSANYELFVDQRTAHAICAMRSVSDELYLMESTNPINAGEANIASSELSADGHLRITFHRGAFATGAAIDLAQTAAAIVVNDIQLDTIEAFLAPGNAASRNVKRRHEDIRILLEDTGDNYDFAPGVIAKLKQINPVAASRAHAVPSLQHVRERELRLYLDAPQMEWDQAQRQAVLTQLTLTGTNTREIDSIPAFEHVRLVSLTAGEILIDAGSPASFAYIPLGDGLRGQPLGGYPPFSVRAWTILGNTGIVRGASRNATVSAVKDLTLLMIPKEVFLSHWHHPYTPAEFIDVVSQRFAENQ